MNKLCIALLLPLLGCTTPGSADTPGPAARVSRVEKPTGVTTLPANVPGRTLRSSDGDTYQWPGVYFEASFHGPNLFFKVGPGDVILRVLVDKELVATLAKPAPGFYEIANLTKRQHTVRVETVTESQAAPNVFGGFMYSKASKPLAIAPRVRQIEFIGDSHTVGYGNSSTTRECSSEGVWKTTDTSQAFAPKVARHYEADYQVNAISGRGIVRNYGGSPGDPLPEAYPFVLLDHATRYESSAWRPQVLVIALGTNDFSTPLGPAEKWKTREELHTDYEASYVRFIEDLRARNRDAFIVVWATDMAEGEIASEAGKVVARLQSAGEKRIAFMPMSGLAMTGCHWHPSLADDDAISAALIQVIDKNLTSWGAH